VNHPWTSSAKGLYVARKQGGQHSREDKRKMVREEDAWTVPM